MHLFLNIHWRLSGRKCGVQKEENQTYSSSFFSISLCSSLKIWECVSCISSVKGSITSFTKILTVKNGVKFSLHPLPPTNPSSKSEQNKSFKDMAIYQCASAIKYLPH